MAVMTVAIHRVSQDLRHEEKKDAPGTIAVAELLLILGLLHYLAGNYGKAEQLLVRYVAIAKEQFGQNTRETLEGLGLLFEIYVELNRAEVVRIVNEANAVARKLGTWPHPPLVEALLLRAEGFEDENKPQKRQQAFAFALMSLCWCMTRGFDRDPASAQVLERLHVFLKSHGIGEEWEWVVKHARLKKYDFVGLLSILLHHTGLAPKPLSDVAKRGSARPTHRTAQP